MLSFSKRSRLVCFLLLGLVLYTTSGCALPSQAAPSDERHFDQTGYRIDDDRIWEYFQARGGIDTFGYPVSERFMFRGFPVQVFQRHVLQASGDQARPLNLLDPDLMPVIQLNGSTFPIHRSAIAEQAPSPGTPNYGMAVQEYLERMVPNVWEGLQVDFLNYYLSAAPATAGGLRPLVALEVWGFPTSEPARDPNNHNFIYQRFQRGIMHHDATSGVTRGILLGDAFKKVLADGEIAAVLTPVSAATTARPAATATVAASAPTPSATPTLGPPPPLPTWTDGRYPKAQEPGFAIYLVANTADDPIENPTSITWDSYGAMYVSSMAGPIVRIGLDGTRGTYADGFNVPVGLAFRPGTNDLYVSHRGGVTILRDKDGDGVAEERVPFLTGMFCCYAEMHQTEGIQFGPDGWLYVSQGANSDHGEVEGVPWHAGILRAHPDQGQESLEYVATGVRNAYDLVVRRDGSIFATDNGADYGPPDELNHIIPGEDYGWPYCVTRAPWEVEPHPSWNDPARCEGTRPAIATFVPHASANGITAYEAGQFPAEYHDNLFVALWSHIEDAYRIVRVQLTPSGDTFTTTVTPFVTDLELPLDVAVGPEGALYIADWGPGRIYKVLYRP
ncbi:MAG: PQQ-dependent sugar dehydrogenase [Chloroflexota bacterium]|nr:PQQ-dependent sugar dehydrogenase [Chloroflexota bacterium]